MTVQKSETPIQTTDLRDGNWWPNVIKFLARLEGHPDMWHGDADLKYLNVRVDTRDGAFRLSDRNGNPVHPDRVLEALKNVRT